MAVLDALGDQVGVLIHNLIKGNTKKARSLADSARQDLFSCGRSIASQNLIEDMAQEQAIKSVIINFPSLFPGIGTIISFWLLGAENFLILDQSVRLVLTLWIFHDHPEGNKRIDDFVIEVIGEAYNLVNNMSGSTPPAITRKYMTKELPQQYVKMGLNKLLSRLFPYRSRFRLVPFIGIATSAVDGYETIVRVGQVALKLIQRHA
jgi:hypothetical protein